VIDFNAKPSDNLPPGAQQPKYVDDIGWNYIKDTGGNSDVLMLCGLDRSDLAYFGQSGKNDLLIQVKGVDGFILIENYYLSAYRIENIWFDCDNPYSVPDVDLRAIADDMQANPDPGFWG